MSRVAFGVSDKARAAERERADRMRVVDEARTPKQRARVWLQRVALIEECMSEAADLELEAYVEWLVEEQRYWENLSNPPRNDRRSETTRTGALAPWGGAWVP